MDTSIQAPHRDEEITWGDLREITWQRRYLICGFALTCMLLAAIAAWLSPKEYEASVLVSPVTSEGGGHFGSLSSMISQFGGLASLAGIASPTDTKRAESLAILESAALTERYIDQNHLLPVLFPKLWDARQGRWLVSSPKKVPDLWKANRYFAASVRKVTIDPKTNLVTLRIRWTDPVEAAEWANGLVAMTNEYTRQKAIEQSQRDIAYLTDQAAKTDVVGVRQEIYSLLQTQIDNMMLARGTEEYALKVLDPAQPPERPSSPQRVIWTLAGLLGGLLVGLLAAFALGKRPEEPLPASRREQLEHGVPI